jgi:hypothetical protein
VIVLALVVTLTFSNAGGSSRPGWRLGHYSSAAPARMPSPHVSPLVRRSYVVPASIPADCSADAAQPLQGWLARLPNHSRISFPIRSCYRVEETLKLRNRSSLVFDGNGVTLRSLTAPTEHRAIWHVIDSRDIVFKNMIVHGAYENGGEHDAALQHAHAFDLRGTSAEIANVELTDLPGDCVYFGRGPTKGRSSGLITDMTCVRTSRNAVSVTAGDDILIRDVTTDAIGLTAFDIEPNEGNGWGARRVAVLNSTIGSYALYAYALIGNAPISDQTFVGNRGVGRKPRLGILGKWRPRRIAVYGNSVMPSSAAPISERCCDPKVDRCGERCVAPARADHERRT